MVGKVAFLYTKPKRKGDHKVVSLSFEILSDTGVEGRARYSQNSTVCCFALRDEQTHKTRVCGDRE